MAVQTSVTIRTGEAEIKRLLESVNEGVLRGLANEIGGFSPVDTGTYVTTHRIEAGDDLASIPALYTSHGKPRKQDVAQYQGIGIARMQSQIGALPMDRPSYIIGNESEHRAEVEDRLGHKVFGNAAARFDAIVMNVKAGLGIK